MKNFSTNAKLYITTTIFVSILILAYYMPQVEWNQPGIYLLAGLATIGQVLKLEGPTARSHYNLGWIVYGFTLVNLGLPPTLFVILAAHLIEWIWHKYPWYIQSFNIGVYVITATTASLLYAWIAPSDPSLQILSTIAPLIALLWFTLINHWMVGVVIKLARGQSFKESGVFEPKPLMIDFTMLGMGAGAALVWNVNPFAVIFTITPLFLIHNALKVPALLREVEMLEKTLQENETGSITI